MDPVPFGGLKRNTSTVQLEGLAFWIGTRVAETYVGAGWGDSAAGDTKSFVDVHVTSAAPWLVQNRKGYAEMMGNVSDVTLVNASDGTDIHGSLPKFTFTFPNCSFNDTLGTFVNVDGDNVTSCTEERWNYTGAMEMTFPIPR
jgi:hypothetical protein